MTVTRLGPDTLGAVRGVQAPTYDRDAATRGVVHIGLGAFGRAHVARYCDDLLAAGDDTAAIAGVSLRTGSTTTALTPQDGLYTLIESDGSDTTMRVVGAVTALAHGTDALCHLSSPRVSAVTVTVTEKGYCRDAHTGRLDSDHPDVSADLRSGEGVDSLPGALVAGLGRRRELGVGGLAIVSCDNLPANGEALRAVVLEMAARRQDLGLCQDALDEWIDDNVSFPSTVVDRIVPATTDADRELVLASLGMRDEAPVRSEIYRSWVIERCEGLPGWERVGAVLTDDLAPHQDRKLRLVNALHSAAAYKGLLAGHETIAAAVTDSTLRADLIRLGVEEIAPTLPTLEQDMAMAPVATEELVAGVLARFANASLGHRCEQVGADGSQKLGPRILATAAIRGRRGDRSGHLATVVAAWVAHVESARRGRVELIDPLASRLLDAAAAPEASDRVRRLLGVIAAPVELLDDGLFVDAVVDGLTGLESP